jgi:hypothetical protein
MNSNADEKMYKKKYLKYKMKYLSLQRGSGFFGPNKEEQEKIKKLCTFDGKTYVTCIDKYTQEGIKKKYGRSEETEKILAKSAILNYRSGKIIFENGDEYYGNLFKGLPEGRGSIKYKGKKDYEPECDWIEGKQVIKFKDGDYVGELKDGKKNGNGKMMYADGRVYDGAWKDDEKNGQGTMLTPHRDGVRSAFYNGTWVKDLENGQGSMIYANGDYYNGNWRYGFRNGNGRMVYKEDGKIYEGNWIDNKRDTRKFDENNKNKVKCFEKATITTKYGNFDRPWRDDEMINFGTICSP